MTIRAPLILKVRRREVQQPSIGANLLTTTLVAVIAAAPFAQHAWPNPVRAPTRDAVQQLPSLLTTTLAPAQPARPFAQYEWPVPQRRALGAALSLQTATFRYEVIPFSQMDWPNPLRRAAERPRTWTLDLQHTTLAPAAAPPLRPIDWQVPRGRSSQPWLRVAECNLQESTLAPAPADPLRPIAWQNPRGRAAQPWLRSHDANLLLTTLQVADAVPFAQYDWPLSFARRASSAGFTFDPLRSTLQLPNPKPFLQSEWPVPIGPEFPVELRTWTLQSPINLGIPVVTLDARIVFTAGFEPSLFHTDMEPSTFEPEQR